MSTISKCYESVLWLQSHMLPCNFGETPVFWNPVPGGEGSASRMRGSRMSRSHDLTCRTLRVNLHLPNCLVCWVSVSRMRQPDVNSNAVNQREYWTFDVIKSTAIECVRAQQGVHKVSTILGAVTDSRNSKTIEQRRSDSGRRFGDDCECNTGPDLDPN